MRLHVLGANGTYPTRRSPASGYLLLSGDTRLLIDAGAGVALALHEVMDPADLDGVVVSHGHPDHSSDVLAVHNYLRFGCPRRRGMPLVAPGDTIDRLAAYLGAGPGHAFFSVFAAVPVSAGDEVAIGGAVLSFATASHPIPAVMVRVDDGERSLVYTGDTGPIDTLAAFAAGADLLLCEASLQGEAVGERYPYHLSAAEAGEVARAAGVARLVITHVAPTLDPERSAREAGSRYGGPVVLAAPGLEIEV